MLVLSHYPSDPRVRREAEALVKNGYRVDIICMSSPKEPKIEYFKGIRVFRILEGHTKDNIAKYILLTIRFLLKSFLFINKLSSENKYSVIQVHNMPDFLVFAAVLQKLKGTPVLLDLHDVMTELFKSRWNNGIKRFFLPLVGLVEKMSWAFSDSLITTSYGFEKCLLNRGVRKEKVTLIFNTADPDIFSKPKTTWSFNKENPRFLYHGTVAERFGIHVAIDAVKKLKVNCPSIRFDIYGSYQNDYKEKLLSQVEENNLTGNIFFHDYVPLENISEIIRNSDFGIVPYISDSFMDLALSTKTFEYVSLKLPVIASDLPSMRTIFDEEQIIYFNQNDSDNLAGVLNNILSGTVIIKEKVNKAVLAYKHINWSTMVRNYIGVIEKLTSHTFVINKNTSRKLSVIPRASGAN